MGVPPTKVRSFSISASGVPGMLTVPTAPVALSNMYSPGPITNGVGRWGAAAGGASAAVVVGPPPNGTRVQPVVNNKRTRGASRRCMGPLVVQIAVTLTLLIDGFPESPSAAALDLRAHNRIFFRSSCRCPQRRQDGLPERPRIDPLLT